jgi:hypothetical protein
MARIWQRYNPPKRSSTRRTAKKPKNTVVNPGGHKRRTVNAPKAY